MGISKKSGVAALEVAMQAGDPDAFVVYADLLIQQGDPRGELIQVQHQRATQADKKLATAEAALLKKHAAALVGPFAAHKKGLTWKLGFVNSVTLAKPTAETLRALLDHPSARFLAHLEIDVGHDAAPGIILQLAKQRLPSLRTLKLTQGYSSWNNPTPDPGSPTYKTDWGAHDHKKGDALWAALPGLEKLTISGYNLFHTLALQGLRELAIEEGYPFCDGGAWQLPKLEKLSWSLCCDDTGTGVDFSTDTLSPIWKSKLPALRHVDLGGCEAIGYVDLEELDLDEDEMDNATATALRRQRGFKKLAKQLDVLLLPDDDLKTKKQIAAWLAG